MNHDARLQRRIDMVRELQELGYDRQAPFILERLQSTLLERPKDDPMVKAPDQHLWGQVIPPSVSWPHASSR